MAEIKIDAMEMLLRLTAELAETRGRLKALEEENLPASLESIDEKVGGLKESLAAVTAAVQQMRAEPEEEEEEPEPWPRPRTGCAPRAGRWGPPPRTPSCARKPAW
ncbi:hypothetical protein G3I71_49630 [Streptomyces sp. SID12501]|uniref:Uncharacterized protein n=1 Tax=Streptomyces sp. SID12501 TaxID=2706042 RepID=A0A6B3CAZ1_9ACTN|nr:hypothetical protein [Streptomyces sp. SID12501]